MHGSNPLSAPFPVFHKNRWFNRIFTSSLAGQSFTWTEPAESRFPVQPVGPAGSVLITRTGTRLITSVSAIWKDRDYYESLEVGGWWVPTREIEKEKGDGANC